MRILLVEDEKRLSAALVQILSKNKYTVDPAYDGEYGLDCALSGIYDAVILDIMLPKLDGFSVLKRLRGEKVTTPVLLLTARDEVDDKVRGLDCGADDYLTKPFATEELLARLRALLRRPADMATDNMIEFGDITLDMSAFRLLKGTKEVDLGPKEFDILKLLLSAKNSVVSKEDILSKVWGYDTDADYNNVEVYISFVRRKLEHLEARVQIKTVRGVGYRLEESDDKEA